MLSKRPAAVGLPSPTGAAHQSPAAYTQEERWKVVLYARQTIQVTLLCEEDALVLETYMHVSESAYVMISLL